MKVSTQFDVDLAQVQLKMLQLKQEFKKAEADAKAVKLGEKMAEGMKESVVAEFRKVKAAAAAGAAEAARAAAAEWDRIITPAVTDSWRVHRASGGMGTGAFGRTPAAGGGGGMRSLGGAGMQLQDVAVQAQMGTSASVIIGQQGSQLLGAFGPGGAIAGAAIAVGAAFVTMGQKGKEQFEILKKESAEFAESTERLLAAGDVDALAAGYGKIEERIKTLNKLADDGATVWGRFKGALAEAMGGESVDAQAAEVMNQQAKALEQAFAVQKRAVAVSAEDLEISRAKAAGELGRVRSLERERALAAEIAKIEASEFAPGVKSKLKDNAREASRITGEAEDEKQWKEASEKRIALTKQFQEAQNQTDSVGLNAAMKLVALDQERLQLEKQIKAAGSGEEKLKLATQREGVERQIIEAQRKLAEESQSAEDARQKNIKGMEAQIQQAQTAGLPPAERARVMGAALKETLSGSGGTMEGLDKAIAGASNSAEKERLLGLKKTAMEQEKALRDLAPKPSDTIYQGKGDFGKAAGFLSGGNPNDLIAVSIKDQALKVAEGNKLLTEIREILKVTRPNSEPTFD